MLTRLSLHGLNRCLTQRFAGLAVTAVQQQLIGETCYLTLRLCFGPEYQHSKSACRASSAEHKFQFATSSVQCQSALWVIRTYQAASAVLAHFR